MIKTIKLKNHVISYNDSVNEFPALLVYLVWAKRFEHEMPDLIGIATDEGIKETMEKGAKGMGYKFVLVEAIETNHTFGKSMMRALSEITFKSRKELDGD